MTVLEPSHGKSSHPSEIQDTRQFSASKPSGSLGFHFVNEKGTLDDSHTKVPSDRMSLAPNQMKYASLG